MPEIARHPVRHSTHLSLAHALPVLLQPRRWMRDPLAGQRLAPRVDCLRRPRAGYYLQRQAHVLALALAHHFAARLQNRLSVTLLPAPKERPITTQNSTR